MSIITETHWGPLGRLARIIPGLRPHYETGPAAPADEPMTLEHLVAADAFPLHLSGIETSGSDQLDLIFTGIAVDRAAETNTCTFGVEHRNDVGNVAYVDVGRKNSRRPAERNYILRLSSADIHDQPPLTADQLSAALDELVTRGALTQEEREEVYARHASAHEQWRSAHDFDRRNDPNRGRSMTDVSMWLADHSSFGESPVSPVSAVIRLADRIRSEGAQAKVVKDKESGISILWLWVGQDKQEPGIELARDQYFSDSASVQSRDLLEALDYFCDAGVLSQEQLRNACYHMTMPADFGVDADPKEYAPVVRTFTVPPEKRKSLVPIKPDYDDDYTGFRSQSTYPFYEVLDGDDNGSILYIVMLGYKLPTGDPGITEVWQAYIGFFSSELLLQAYGEQPKIPQHYVDGTVPQTETGPQMWPEFILVRNSDDDLEVEPGLMLRYSPTQLIDIDRAHGRDFLHGVLRQVFRQCIQNSTVYLRGND